MRDLLELGVSTIGRFIAFRITGFRVWGPIRDPQGFMQGRRVMNKVAILL